MSKLISNGFQKWSLFTVNFPYFALNENGPAYWKTSPVKHGAVRLHLNMCIVHLFSLLHIILQITNLMKRLFVYQICVHEPKKLNVEPKQFYMSI